MKSRGLILLLVMCWCEALGQSPIDEFSESFSGTGEYMTTDGLYSGLENPDWLIVGTKGQFTDSGFAIRNQRGATHLFTDRLLGRGSFTERIEFVDSMMKGGIRPDFESVGEIFLEHRMDLRDLEPGRDDRLMISLVSNQQYVDQWLLATNTGGPHKFILGVPKGTHISLEIQYDDALSRATFLYDHNLDDQDPAISLGPFKYRSGIDTTQRSHFWTGASALAEVTTTIDNWSLKWTPSASLGDFNGNGVLDVTDIDQLSADVRSGANNPAFDLNSDSKVDANDRTVWVEGLRKTYFGDSNLDGEFSSRDLVEVFQASHYEDSIEGNSTWATGDWNGDAEFSSRDLVLAFTSGGYENGPRAALHSVPEPALSVIVGLVCLVSYCRRGRG